MQKEAEWSDRKLDNKLNTYEFKKWNTVINGRKSKKSGVGGGVPWFSNS